MQQDRFEMNDKPETGAGKKLVNEFLAQKCVAVGAGCPSAIGLEHALIEQIHLGDSIAFELLIRPHRRRLEQTVYRIVRNTHDAEDIVQQCLLKIFVKLHQFQGKSQFSTWITRIAINQSLMHLRNGRRVFTQGDLPSDNERAAQSLDLPDPCPTPEENYIATEIADMVRTHIDKLPESKRIVLEKLYLEELSLEETAQTLGISVSAAKSRALRARTELRRVFTGRATFSKLGNSVIIEASKGRLLVTTQ
jgi:RNA polymerase sigma-70 factor (ECF subfamily)